MIPSNWLLNQLPPHLLVSILSFILAQMSHCSWCHFSSVVLKPDLFLKHFKLAVSMNTYLFKQGKNMVEFSPLLFCVFHLFSIIIPFRMQHLLIYFTENLSNHSCNDITFSSYKIPKFLWHMKSQCVLKTCLLWDNLCKWGEQITFWPTHTPNLSSGIKP